MPHPDLPEPKFTKEPWECVPFRDSETGQVVTTVYEIIYGTAPPAARHAVLWVESEWVDQSDQPVIRINNVYDAHIIAAAPSLYTQHEADLATLKIILTKTNDPVIHTIVNKMIDSKITVMRQALGLKS